MKINSKILITGANGYIGSCLLQFLKNKFNVIGIDKENSKLKAISTYAKTKLLCEKKIQNEKY